MTNSSIQNVIFWMLVASGCTSETTRDNIVQELKSEFDQRNDGFAVFSHNSMSWWVDVSRETLDGKTIVRGFKMVIEIYKRDLIEIATCGPIEYFSIPYEIEFKEICKDIFKERNVTYSYASMLCNTFRSGFEIQDMTIDSILFTTSKLISVMIDTWRNHLNVD